MKLSSVHPPTNFIQYCPTHVDIGYDTRWYKAPLPGEADQSTSEAVQCPPSQFCSILSHPQQHSLWYNMAQSSGPWGSRSARPFQVFFFNIHQHPTKLHCFCHSLISITDELISNPQKKLDCQNDAQLHTMMMMLLIVLAIFEIQVTY